jgi:hypothetical protein
MKNPVGERRNEKTRRQTQRTPAEMKESAYSAVSAGCFSRLRTISGALIKGVYHTLWRAGRRAVARNDADVCKQTFIFKKFKKNRQK